MNRDPGVTPTVHPGDYQLIAGNGPAMWAVRIGTRSRFGHARIAVAVNDTGITVVEAQPAGAVMRVLSPTETGDGAWYRPHPYPSPQAACDRARTLLGTPYGWIDIAALACRYVLHVDWRWVDAHIQREDVDICSQLVAIALRSGGVTVDPTMLPCEIVPGALDIPAWRL